MEAGIQTRPNSARMAAHPRPGLIMEVFSQSNPMRLDTGELARAFLLAYERSGWEGLEGIGKAEQTIKFYARQAVEGNCNIFVAKDPANGDIAAALIALKGNVLFERLDPEAIELGAQLGRVFRDMDPRSVSYRAERFTSPLYRQGGVSKELIRLETEAARDAGQVLIMSQTLAGNDPSKVLESVLKNGGKVVEGSETDLELEVSNERIRGAKVSRRLVYWVKSVLEKVTGASALSNSPSGEDVSNSS